MNCPKCGTPIIAGAASCTRCGVSLGTRTISDATPVSFYRFCSRCGNRVEETDVFCLHCGARILIPRQPLAPRDQWRRYIAIGGLIVLLVLLIVGGLTVYRPWRQGREMSAHYEWGTTAIQQGDYAAALQELSWVIEHDPDYRDAEAQIEIARSQANLVRLYSQAQSYHDRGQWDLAVRVLEQLQERAPDHEVDSVKTMLFDAYFNTGLTLANHSNFARAVHRFDQCLTLQLDDEAQHQRDLAVFYPQGLAALEQDDYAGAIQSLYRVYTLDPNYHDVAGELYQAYLAYCIDLEDSGDLAGAEAECRSAYEIKPADGKAVVELTRIAYLHTPTLTPTPTLTLIPIASPSPTDIPTSAITPSATPRPITRCRYAAKNLIGFKRQKRCNQVTGDGCGKVEIWLMNADGTNQKPMCNPQAYYWGLERDRTSPDGAWRVEVSRQKPDIIRVYTDGRWEWLIVNNRQDWDPVLSADGWWLAWVTNRNANDEIYIKTMDPSDQQQRRLTVNQWEWDKHPTWSPDGRKIAFYTNRANSLNEATRQIWVMEITNDQGINLKNLSNSPNNVDIDPVWFKWDGIPR